MQPKTVSPTTLVIAGATGDLAQRKLVPALYNLALDGLLPDDFALVGFSRREFTREEFIEFLREAVDTYSRRRPIDPALWSKFTSKIAYVSGDLGAKESYEKLRQALTQFGSTSRDVVFYLATAPEFFGPAAKYLSEVGLLSGEAIATNPDAWKQSRVIVEKPFGHDLESAKKLNQELLNAMREEQIYRIDHYLGKETVQNILVFRFANGIFEPLWNHKYVSHVEITVAETIGVGTRAGYFDKSGILRDMVQNHALQLLCLVALEPPVSFEANAVRDEKVKVLRSIRKFSPEDVANKVVRGRYLAGKIGNEAVAGYLGEAGVDKKSETETYVGIEFAIDNWRWNGVPFYLRAGKRLSERVTEISVFFREAPHLFFEKFGIDQVASNVLTFQIQPDEGIFLRVNCKPPGPSVKLQGVDMEFSYGKSFGVEPPEAYERLLLDAMKGDPTLFTRNDEIEQAWAVVAPILEAWKTSKLRMPPVYGYEAGSAGPSMADELLLRRIGRGWYKS
ncbi:glucose-6-phosphate dehydrogenase [bacterium]|nr:glucose-6-phosphate dehydrogenase [bacterium]